ncbi:MAG TPA: hypothetical protein VI731_01740 [Bacteroidia bacterium]|nr:hypothetical protein [Bacteroidia bacterium]
MFLVAIALAGCRKDPPPPPQPPGPSEAQLVEEFKAYTFFKEGSYWVYEDSASGVLDSIFVYYTEEGQGPDNEGVMRYWFRCHKWSAGDSTFYYDWFHSSWTSVNPYRSKVFRDMTFVNQTIGSTILMEYPIVTGNILYSSGNGSSSNITTTLQKHESIQLGANVFYEVCEITHSLDPPFDTATRFFIAKNVGIIKRVISGNKTWTLLRFHIQE